MSDLSVKKCVPCEGGTQPLSPAVAAKLLEQIPNWKLAEDGKSIHRRFEFKGFYKTMAFINAMAWIANKQMHHPDFSAGYNFCAVTFTTHAIDGVSENDFICAAQVDELLTD